MADNTLKSLLSKASTPGSTFGELAGMYISGNRKKDNRARNVLLASLFFNAKESSMQSKVLRQLEDLEDEKTNAVANRTFLFNEGLKKQNKYDEIKNKGIYKYYKDDAEAAFYENDEYLQNKEFYDTAGLKEKESWKQSWSDDQYNEFLKTYDEKAPRITTVENFNKPLNDFFKAKQREIANPSNISLVHKAFGFLPGAKERDRQLKQKTSDTAAIIGYDPNTATITPKAKTMRDKMLAVPQNSSYNRIINKDDITIGLNQFDDIARSEFNLDKSSPEYLSAFDDFAKLGKDDQTVGTAIQNIKGAILNRFVISSQNTMKQAQADIDSYIEMNSDVKIEKGSDEYNKLVKRNVRTKLGISSPTEEILETSERLAQLTVEAMNIENPEDRQKYIDQYTRTFVDEQIAISRGLKTPSRMRQEAEIEMALTLATAHASGDQLLQARVRTITIPQSVLVQQSKELREFVAGLSEGDTGLASNSANIMNSEFEAKIYELQQNEYDRNFMTSFLNVLDLSIPTDPNSKPSGDSGKGDDTAIPGYGDETGPRITDDINFPL